MNATLGAICGSLFAAAVIAVLILGCAFIVASQANNQAQEHLDQTRRELDGEERP